MPFILLGLALGGGFIVLSKKGGLGPIFTSIGTGAATVTGMGTGRVFADVDVRGAASEAGDGISILEEQCLIACPGLAEAKAAKKKDPNKRKKKYDNELQKCQVRCRKRAQKERRKAYKNAVRKGTTTQTAGRRSEPSNKFGQSFSPSVKV